MADPTGAPVVILLTAILIGTGDMPAPLFTDFVAGRYGAVVQQVDSALARPQGLTPRDLALLHLWKGFAMAAWGRSEEARQSFAVALSLDQSLSLDPREVSPKIVAEFDAVRAAASLPTPQVRSYLLLEDLRARAALRSMVMPGWGQWTLGRKTGGLVAGGVFLGLVAAWVATGSWEDRAHTRYLRARDAEVESAYDEYNQAHKIHAAVGALAVTTWVASLVDVLARPGPPPRIRSQIP